MEFLNPITHIILLVLHIIGVIIGVGTVTVTDYFHVIGLRKKKLERRLIIVYPIFASMIKWAILLIIITGAILLLNKPFLLEQPLVILKLSLFGVVLINGYILHKHVYPHTVRCVMNEKAKCPIHVLWVSALAGSISFVTWYSILIIALTKQFGYSVISFLAFYIAALIIIGIVIYITEKKARVWKKSW
jgi:hypothetical protein